MQEMQFINKTDIDSDVGFYFLLQINKYLNLVIIIKRLC